MAETGHAVNVANFETLISRCTGYGARYNPTNNLLKIVNMTTLHTSAKNALNAVTPSKQPFVNATNARQPLFQSMEKLSTRVVNALDATEDVTDELVADAKTILRKIRGARKVKLIENPNPDDPQQISASQQSYNQQLQHFNDLVALVSGEPLYVPNEVELQTASLTTFASDLDAANQLVITTATPYLTALTKRDKFLYEVKTGVVDVALEAKKYVKSVSTITLTEFRQISGLKFTRPKKTQ